MKEVMAIVFFGIEKAYDSIWREGLLITMNKLGIDGRLHNWIMDSEISESFDILDGIPQGSAISPKPFNIMINNTFENTGTGIQSSLHADDGAI